MCSWLSRRRFYAGVTNTSKFGFDPSVGTSCNFQNTHGFKHFAKQTQGVELLQRSIAAGGSARLPDSPGISSEELESLARTLAKNAELPEPVKAGGVTTDCCDVCLSCRKIDHDTHAECIGRGLSPNRASSPSMQTRELMREIQLKPTEAEYKVAVIAGADRLNVQAANAFLKTLEEPPGKSVLILLSTEPQRILENNFVALSAPEFFSAKAPARLTGGKWNGSRISTPWRPMNKKVCWGATGCSTRCCKGSAKSG